MAAQLALGRPPEGVGRAVGSIRRPDWPDDLAEVVYIDGFGNVVTGLRAAAVAEDAELMVGGQRLRRAAIFSDVPLGQAFWYENANGLVEFAVNQGRADRSLGISVGSGVNFAIE